MSFFFQYSPLLLLLCALVAAAGTYWSYRNTVPALPTAPRILLGGLRFASIFLICFLLFEPVLQTSSTRTERPVLAVLIDDSQSVSTGAGSDTTTRAFVPAAVLDALDMPDDVEVRGYRFSSGAASIGGARASWLDSLRGAGERTDISGALQHVAQDLRDGNFGGVILLSDGRYNTGRNPVYTAEQYPVPIHTVVLGDTTAQRDVVLGRITANRVAYVGVEQPVEVDVRATGFPGSRLAVTLTEGGRQRDQTSVHVSGESAQIPVQLSYTPTEPGLRNLTLSVTELEGELTHRNNHASLPVRVLEQKRQVLLLGAAPEPDVAAARQVFSANANIDLTVRVQKSASAFYEGALTPELLEGTDAIVLVGFPGRATSTATASMVASAIASGTPAIFILTRSTDLARLSTTLGAVLPVRTEADRGGWMEALPLVTAAGLQHPALEGAEAGGAAWKRLPPLLISESRWQASPDARILANAEVRGVALDEPLIVVRTRSGTRTAAVLGAGTWRWKNLPADLQGVESLWPTTLDNLLQWVTAARDQRPVRVRPIADVFSGGEPVEFVGEIYDESMRPVSGATLELQMTSDGGQEHLFRFSDVGNGRYVLEAGGLTEGTYAFQATAQLGRAELGTDSGSFAVGELSLEHRDTRADPALMQQIAARSGGQMVYPDGVGTLGSNLQGDATLQPSTASIIQETNLRRKPVFLLLIVLLLTTEWVLRKRSGLA